MTDNEIIKAFECCEFECDCTDCPKFTGQGCMGIASEVFDLVNRQQEEIQRLDIELQAMRGAANSYKAEVERLTILAELGNMRANDYRAMRDKAKNARAEAIKEFATKVKQEAAYCDPITDEMIWLESNFDNLVKEMTE